MFQRVSVRVEHFSLRIAIVTSIHHFEWFDTLAIVAVCIFDSHRRTVYFSRPWAHCVDVGKHFVCLVRFNMNLRFKLSATLGRFTDESQIRWQNLDANLIHVYLIRRIIS